VATLGAVYGGVRRCTGGVRSRPSSAVVKRPTAIWWLNQRDILIVKADRQAPLLVLRMSLAADIAKGAA
jgi:hypothetical protein